MDHVEDELGVVAQLFERPGLGFQV